MKRLLVSIIAVLYFAVSTGTTVHMHYCMGRLVGIALWHDDEDNCSKCGMKKKNDDNGCCKNEHKLVKNDSQHLLGKASFESAPQYFAILPEFTPYSYTEHISVAQEKCVAFAHAPPDDRRCCPIYIRVCDFRI